MHIFNNLLTCFK